MAFTSKNQNSFSKKIFTILTYSYTYACVLSHIKGFSHSNLWKGDFFAFKKCTEFSTKNWIQYIGKIYTYGFNFWTNV